eukprot:2112196-Rhodomonas_salina.2
MLCENFYPGKNHENDADLDSEARIIMMILRVELSPAGAIRNDACRSAAGAACCMPVVTPSRPTVTGSPAAPGPGRATSTGSSTKD